MSGRRIKCQATYGKIMLSRVRQIKGLLTRADTPGTHRQGVAPNSKSSSARSAGSIPARGTKETWFSPFLSETWGFSHGARGDTRGHTLCRNSYSMLDSSECLSATFNAAQVACFTITAASLRNFAGTIKEDGSGFRASKRETSKRPSGKWPGWRQPTMHFGLL